jgi:hypothetical protein
MVPIVDQGVRTYMRVLRTFAGSGAAALLLAAGLAGPAAAAASPTGVYAGMGTCPLTSAALQSASSAEVGCAVATIGGGSITIGGISVPLTGTMTSKFGFYWPENGPTVSFPDGNSADVFSTVAPTDGNELSGPVLDVPIPGLSNYVPGLTSAFVQVSLAGPITEFAPLSTGENYPLFELPLKFHLWNAFLGTNCYVGSDSAPILLEPTAGTTAPPAPNTPITGDSGTVSLNSDPNGYNDLIVGFSGATLVDNSFSVPGASGCGIIPGTANWLVNLLFGLGSAAGHNSATLTNVSTTLAADSSISDLSAAIKASE